MLALSSAATILALGVVSLVCSEIFFIVRWLRGDFGVCFLVNGKEGSPTDGGDDPTTDRALWEENVLVCNSKRR